MYISLKKLLDYNKYSYAGGHSAEEIIFQATKILGIC